MIEFRSGALRVVALIAVLSLALLSSGGGAASASAPPPRDDDSGRAGWTWPVTPPEVVAPFVEPSHDYGPGHRGIDLRAPFDSEVVSPATGVIAFAGTVAGRGIVTIDHGAGLVTTLEPVRAVAAIGAPVHTGDVVALVDAGGHAASGTVHFGVRRHGRYIDPMTLLDGIPRAILLPCC